MARHLLRLTALITTAATMTVLVIQPVAAGGRATTAGQVSPSSTHTVTPTATIESAPSPTPTPLPTLAPAMPTAIGEEQAAFTLAEATGGGDIILRGPSPSYSIFLPLPENWAVRRLTLALQVSHSPLLQGDSTLTVEVNGSPVGSLWLTSANSGQAVWPVEIPEAMLKGESLSVRFVGLQRTTDDVCVDIESPGNWLRISADSELGFGYDIGTYQPDLSRLPYPIISARSLGPDHALIVLPQGVTSTESLPALRLSAALGSLSTWRGLTLAAIEPNELTPSLRKSNNLLLVGRVDRLPMLDETTEAWPLKHDAGGTLLDPQGQVIPADTGVVMVAASPWNPARAMLAVTGSSDEAVDRAARAIQFSDFSSMARAGFALIPTDPVDRRSETVWDITTLGALGYSDQIVHGVGRQALTYAFNLPNSRIPELLDLTLDISHSSVLLGDRSFASLLVNGIPQSGTYLTSKNGDHGLWKVSIAADQIQPGRNVIEVLFDLHVSDNEACDDTYYDQAWAVVHAASSASVTFSSGGLTPDLADFPIPFDAGTIVVLPSRMEEDERTAAVDLFRALGANLGPRASAIEALTPDQVNSERLQASNAILLGRPAYNLWVGEALKVAPLRFNGSVRSLQGELRGLTLGDDSRMGVAQVMHSPWSAVRSVLVISGTDAPAVRRITEALLDDQVRSSLVGDVALVDEQGRVTWIDSRTPAKAVPASTESEQRSFRILQLSLIGVLAGVAIGLVVVLVRRQRQH